MAEPRVADASPARRLGTIRIRVVVMKKGEAAGSAEEPPDTGEAGDDPLDLDFGKGPLDSYLERSPRGKECIVILVNGQRHEGWDNTFIVRDLGFKHLRKRMMIIVELDGLAPEAIAEVVQGSRQGLYEGEVFDEIKQRIVTTLKNDPELEQIEGEAEEEIAQLEASDEAVKELLNSLIEEHHARGEDTLEGDLEPGTTAGQARGFSPRQRQQDVVIEGTDQGQSATGPVLVARPDVSTLRLRPDEDRSVRVTSRPEEAWRDLEALDVRVTPSLDELDVTQVEIENGRDINLLFSEPPDFDKDQYPVERELNIFARFKGFEEPRHLKFRLIINPKKDRQKPPPPTLLSSPTDIRVTARQPVRLVPGGPATHVRVRWNGADNLVTGRRPRWRLSARCLTLATFPTITRSDPVGGSFGLVVSTPQGILVGTLLDFIVEATGPQGQTLSAPFQGQVVEPELPPARGPRRVKASAPVPGGQRRLPYRLVFVTQESGWDTECWGGDSNWSETEAGCFISPSENETLALVINNDYGLLQEFREAMVKRGLVEGTVERRVKDYTSHLAFHLYQMYRYVRQLEERSEREDALQPPDEMFQRDEANRVASTLLRVMGAQH